MNKQPPSTQELTLTRKSIGIKSLSLGLKLGAISHWLQTTDRLFPILELMRLISTMGIVVRFSRSLLELKNTWTGSHLTWLLPLDPWPLVVNDSGNSQLSITVTNAWEVERRKEAFVLAEVSVNKLAAGPPPSWPMLKQCIMAESTWCTHLTVARKQSDKHEWDGAPTTFYNGMAQ